MNLKAGLVFSLFIFSIIPETYADDAAVLPQGRWRLRLATAYSQFTNQLNDSGISSSLGSTYSKSLDAKFLSLINKNSAALFKAVNAAPLNANISQAAELKTDVDSMFISNTLVAEYGLTDRLSIGVIVPIIHGEIKVKSTSTPDQNFERVTNNMPDPNLKAAMSQMSAATTTQGLNSLLTNQFQYSSGLKSWSSTGVGDVEIGAKYNYYNALPLKTTFKLGTRLPTGNEKDENVLVNAGFGDGQWDIGAYHYVDYQPLSNLYFTLETGYIAQLPNSGNYRIPLSADLPIGMAPTSLQRKLGDYWEAGLEGNLTLQKYWTISPKYRFKQKFSDSFSGGPAGVDLSLLENNTDELLHEGLIQLEYSNLPAVRAGQSRIPYGVTAFYRQPFAGKNVVDARTAGMMIKSYF